jgi:hypothetical protein
MEQYFNIHNYQTFSKQGYYLPHYKSKNLQKDIDVSFIGGLYRADRKEYIDFLRENGINIYVAGYGSDVGEINSSIKNEIIQRSKIHLNFTKVHNPSRNINSRLHQQKGRLIEASLLRTFVLSESYSGGELIFDSRSEIPTFTDKYDLLEKINFFLKNDELREIALEKCYEKAVNFDTIKVYAEMVEKLNNISIGKKVFISDLDFIERYLSQKYYYFGKFLIRGKIISAYFELKNALLHKQFKVGYLLTDFPRGLIHGIKNV